MRRMKMKLIASALLALGSAAAAAERMAADVALTQATIIDVASGRLVQGRTVLLKGDTILAVVDDKALKNYAPKQTYKLKGKYLMPGLWDSHVHFGGGPALIEENKQLLALYLAHGITTVRDCAGDLSDTVLAWREQINKGELEGPTILASGPKLEGYKPLWKGTVEVGTPEEVSKALDYLQSRKVDFVKITENTMTPPIFLEALRQAKERGLRTSGHVPVQLTLDDMFKAGLGTVEHQSYLLRGSTPREAELTAQVAAGKMTGREAMRASLESYDEATARATFRRMAQAGTAIVPTLIGSQATAYLDQDDHAHDPYLQYIGKGLRATYDWRVQRAAKDDKDAIALRHALFEKSASLLPLLEQEGVSIIAGTDAGFLNSFDYPGQGLHDELGIFVKYGLTPQQALKAAVLAGPRFLGKQERYGVVEAGKTADLLVLDADPLKDISATRKIRMVLNHGKAYDRAKLDAMLADVKRWVEQHPAPAQ
ncbi:amidohydrolase family protein [Pseudoduganella sp. UC29_106]|uniref:amidohydrolase family protein n=1 Tax=Pseudoduganella sp. UC29_106 TaxID=3374553 RepID=UPI003756DCA9